MEHLEASWVCCYELLQLLLYEDVFCCQVAKQQAELCLVLGVLQDCCSYLVHGSHTSATSNHTCSTRNTGEQRKVSTHVSKKDVTSCVLMEVAAALQQAVVHVAALAGH